MGAKHQLQHAFYKILARDNFGSFATRHDRKNFLLRFASEIVKQGFKITMAQELSEKHVRAIVANWQQRGIKNSTIKNRLSMVRHLAVLINKSNIVPSNQELNIGTRSYKPTFNRAIFNPDFTHIADPHLRVSLELQRVFGLRREESIKIKPHMADKGNELKLLGAWCKGGRPREIPIRTDEQRYWLEQAKIVAGKFGYSLIPQHTNYIRHRWNYDKQIKVAGLQNPHGLRHAYAQNRYKELTGWDAPINGGPTAKQLTPTQLEKDQEARFIISFELGHSRPSISAAYLSI